VTTPDESISADAGLAREPVVHDRGGAGTGTAGSQDDSDVESALPDVPTERIADLPEEPGEAHVAAYAAAADELAHRLDASGTGHDDDSP
jgi:hypothetical protein